MALEVTVNVKSTDGLVIATDELVGHRLEQKHMD